MRPRKTKDLYIDLALEGGDKESLACSRVMDSLCMCSWGILSECVDRGYLEVHWYVTPNDPQVDATSHHQCQFVK